MLWSETSHTELTYRDLAWALNERAHLSTSTLVRRDYLDRRIQLLREALFLTEDSRRKPHDHPHEGCHATVLGYEGSDYSFIDDFFLSGESPGTSDISS